MLKSEGAFRYVLGWVDSFQTILLGVKYPEKGGLLTCGNSAEVAKSTNACLAASVTSVCTANSPVSPLEPSAWRDIRVASLLSCGCRVACSFPVKTFSLQQAYTQSAHHETGRVSKLYTVGGPPACIVLHERGAGNSWFSKPTVMVQGV